MIGARVLGALVVGVAVWSEDVLNRASSAVHDLVIGCFQSL